MLRREERRRAGAPEEPDGCLRAIMDLLLFDWLFSFLMDIGCSSCMTMALTACAVIVMLTHGMSHLPHHRPLALAWRPLRGDRG
ncbi:hypothetical protein CCAX7_003880 [Capsulimonas corticalis]|uniref:Uncharacterized protein n=1 Tax=Capsulimonas corticalis TaxID=2219043 RepID=A0A402D2Z9_9BACT|nr:hypothetical protein [Capsulimonas corticalis]BDI28337.1 hypothetical protein CCAX7_003880 [Capsulimonas corticalis]